MSHIRTWIGLTIFCIILSTGVYGQLRELRGYVKDDHSDEPIPYASIGFLGTTIGKLTDSSGRFVFRFSRWPSDTLVITYAGFEETKIPIDTSKSSIEVLIKLQRERKIEGVVVKSKLGRGILLWRKIIKNKNKNDRRSYQRFGYELYNKMEIDLNNVNAEKMQKGILPPKPFKFILNNIDTVSEEKPILPIYLIETLSDYYVEQNPHKTREIVKASKSIGLKNESVTKFLGGTYQNINIYKNFIPFLFHACISEIKNNRHTHENET